MLRVVSLVPSVTETLLAWSVQPVAVTRFCEQPGLTAVGGTKDPDITAIMALQPDLVVVEREENRAADAAALEAAGIPLHVLHVRALADVVPALESLARRLGLEAAGSVPTLPAARPGAVRRRAFVPIWRRPWMSLNGRTYASSLLDAVGVINVLGDDPTTYPVVDLDAVAALRPDVVLAPSEPYPFSERHRSELEAVAPVVLVDGRDLFWWGIRTSDALGRLGRVVGQLPAHRSP